jgi:hypothetical protein
MASLWGAEKGNPELDHPGLNAWFAEIFGRR